MTVREHLRTYRAQSQTRDLFAQLQEKNDQLERFNADLEVLVVERSKELFYRVREPEARDRLARFMMTVHSLAETLDHLVAVVGETLDAQQVEVHMTNTEQSSVVRASWPAHAVPPQEEETAPLIDEASTGRVITRQAKGAFVCAVPIIRDEEILAVLILWARGNAEHAEEYNKILVGISLAAAFIIHEAREGYDVGGWRDALDEALSRVDDLVD